VQRGSRNRIVAASLQFREIPQIFLLYGRFCERFLPVNHAAGQNHLAHRSIGCFEEHVLSRTTDADAPNDGIPSVRLSRCADLQPRSLLTVHKLLKFWNVRLPSRRATSQRTCTTSDAAVSIRPHRFAGRAIDGKASPS